MWARVRRRATGRVPLPGRAGEAYLERELPLARDAAVAGASAPLGREREEGRAAREQDAGEGQAGREGAERRGVGTELGVVRAQAEMVGGAEGAPQRWSALCCESSFCSCAFVSARRVL